MISAVLISYQLFWTIGMGKLIFTAGHYLFQWNFAMSQMLQFTSFEQSFVWHQMHIGDRLLLHGPHS